MAVFWIGKARCLGCRRMPPVVHVGVYGSLTTESIVDDALLDAACSGTHPSSLPLGPCPPDEMHSNSPLAAAQYGGLSFTANLAGLSFAANLACGSLSVTIGYDGLMATTALPSFRSVPQARPSNGCEAPAGCTPGHDVGSVSVGCLCAAIDISERMPLLTLPRLTAMKGSPIRTPQGQPNRSPTTPNSGTPNRRPVPDQPANLRRAWRGPAAGPGTTVSCIPATAWGTGRRSTPPNFFASADKSGPSSP